METTGQFIKFHEGKSKLMPQEEKLETVCKPQKLVIGMPREISLNENRIGLIPEAVKLLTDQGHRVFVEESAGLRSHYSDHDFAESGAEIVDNPQAIFESDIILKIAPPSREELNYLGRRKCLFSILNQATRNRDYFAQLVDKKTIALAFEDIQDKVGSLPLLRSMSEIIGNVTVLLASEYLCHPEYGRGVMFGGFPGVSPVEVVIIGAGAVAEYACRASLGMGALVRVFDNSIYKLRNLQNILGNRIYTSILQPHLISKALETADVVIAAKHASNGVSPCFVSAEIIRKMKQGSIIIDVSIDQGGCFETSRPTTHQNPVYQEYGVTHYCVPNIASKVPQTASISFSNFFTPLLLDIGNNGGIESFLKMNRDFAKGVYVFNGTLTSQRISQNFDLPFQPIDLLLASYY